MEVVDWLVWDSETEDFSGSAAVSALEFQEWGRSECPRGLESDEVVGR